MSRLQKLAKTLLPFSLGSAIVIHDVFFTQLDRPWTLLVALGLLGLPVTQYLDALRALKKDS